MELVAIRSRDRCVLIHSPAGTTSDDAVVRSVSDSGRSGQQNRRLNTISDDFVVHSVLHSSPREAAGRYVLNNATATYAISQSTSGPSGSSLDRPAHLLDGSQAPPAPLIHFEPSPSREMRGALEELARNGALLLIGVPA
jgi:hypothetical protein